MGPYVFDSKYLRIKVVDQNLKQKINLHHNQHLSIEGLEPKTRHPSDEYIYNEEILSNPISHLLDPEIAEVREEGSVCDASCSANDNALMLYNRQYTSSHKIQQRLAVISWLIFMFCILASILSIIDVEFAHSQRWITTSEAFHHAQANITENFEKKLENLDF